MRIMMRTMILLVIARCDRLFVCRELVGRDYVPKINWIRSGNVCNVFAVETHVVVSWRCIASEWSPVQHSFHIQNIQYRFHFMRSNECL